MFDCAVSATRDPLASVVTVSFAVSGLTGTALDLDIVAFNWTGAVTDGARSEATAGVSFLAMVTGGTVGSPAAYVAAKGQYGFADAGTSTLTLTSHSLTASDAYSEDYAVHGSYEATLPAFPASGADPVTISVTF